MLYPVCLKKYTKKLDRHLWRRLFCGSCTITHHSSLKWNHTLLEIWGKCRRKYEKIKKKLRKIWRNSCFKLKQNDLYKLPKQNRHEISNRLYWGLCMVPKNNYAIYVLISIGKSMITFHLFSVWCQRRYCCWNIESKLATWKIVTIMQRW